MSIHTDKSINGAPEAPAILQDKLEQMIVASRLDTLNKAGSMVEFIDPQPTPVEQQVTSDMKLDQAA